MLSKLFQRACTNFKKKKKNVKHVFDRYCPSTNITTYITQCPLIKTYVFSPEENNYDKR